MAQEWPSIKRYEEKIRRQQEQDRGLESVGTPDSPYVQRLSAKERQLAEGILRAQGLSDEQIAAHFFAMDQPQVQNTPKDESARQKQINTQPRSLKPNLKKIRERKAQRELRDELIKVQEMSKDELAVVITSPEFESFPSELQDAYVERMLR